MIRPIRSLWIAWLFFFWFFLLCVFFSRVGIVGFDVTLSDFFL